MYDSVSTLRHSWSVEYLESKETFLQTIRDRTLPNAMPLMQALFHVVSMNTDFVSGKPFWLSPRGSQIETFQFLRRFAWGSPDAKVLKDSIMDLSKSFFGELRKDFVPLIDSDDLIMRLPEDNGKVEGYRKITREEGAMLYFAFRSLSVVTGRVFFEK